MNNFNSRYGSPEAQQQMSETNLHWKSIVCLGLGVAGLLGIRDYVQNTNQPRIACYGQEANPPITNESTTMAAVAERIRVGNPNFDPNVTNRTVVGNSVVRPNGQEGVTPASFRYDLHPGDVVITPKVCRVVDQK